jgi:hypothetical protein
MVSKFTDILGTIVVVALVTTLVLPNRKTASVIKESGNAFANVLKAAQGGGVK